MSSFWDTNTVWIPLSNGTVQQTTYNNNLNPWRNQYVPLPFLRSMDASAIKFLTHDQAGFDAIRVTAVWTPGQSAVPPDQLQELQAVSAAAALDGITIWTTIMPFGSKTTPLTALARKQFAAFSANLVRRVPAIPYVIVGNEPNLNRYWLPQYAPDGTDAAAPAYEKLLAQTYDAIKKVNKNTFVVGGSVSPHGSDDPTNPRQTHSPTAFITDLGTAYRASGRAKPIMDGFAFHPYGENSSVSPEATHLASTSIGLADYDKLVGLLGTAFDGTGQLGSTLPIVYDEYGIESVIPPAELNLYHGREPATTKPVTPDAGRLLRRGADDGRLPTKRQGDVPLPRHRRNGSGALAIRCLLPGRHAEAGPGRRQADDRPDPQPRRRLLAEAARRHDLDRARKHAELEGHDHASQAQPQARPVSGGRVAPDRRVLAALTSGT